MCDYEIMPCKCTRFRQDISRLGRNVLETYFALGAELARHRLVVDLAPFVWFFAKDHRPLLWCMKRWLL